VISGNQTIFKLTGGDPDPGDNVTFHEVSDGQLNVVLNRLTGEVKYTPDLNKPVDMR
jgi:hypothetical protein